MKKLGTLILSLTFFIAAFSIEPASAKASSHSKKTAKQSPKKELSSREKYKGTVDDGTTEEIHAYADIESGNVDEELDSLKPAHLHAVAKSEKLEAKVGVPQKDSSIAQAPAKPTDTDYDLVPPEKIDEISERVKYAYEILKRYGRAYDYKTVTLTELKKILSDLEKQKS